MDDFNAKIGSDNRGYEEIMGKQGLGEMNDNGERFADLCALSNLVIRGSVFHHRRIHKATWVTPDLSTENQIDHLCIARSFRRSLKDTATEEKSREGLRDIRSDQGCQRSKETVQDLVSSCVMLSCMAISEEDLEEISNILDEQFSDEMEEETTLKFVATKIDTEGYI
ncbi:craniofacial development protein 2-like [Dreissena polymorpha]|uniref:craniofacial development protein 2-like n=1 Tax=Dreissena polymorpha TaxID=45954 RepID=UPI0022644492|nr:craniofacial development protein 2-like [Dreissena polymorpha]